jgi:cold shock protein
MKIAKLLMPALVAAAPLFYSCGEKTDVVESGTYQGVIEEVEPEKTEIYVKTADDKVLELYFTDSTSLTKGGETVQFDQLQKGGKVEVQVEKVGQRLDPVAVKILE